MSDIVTLPVKIYRVMNEWEKRCVYESYDLDDAIQRKATHEKLNRHDEFSIVAVLDEKGLPK